MIKKPYNYLIISLIIIFLDQITKIAVRHFMVLGQSISVIGDLFRITYVQNPGAAFSLSFGSEATNRILFSIISFIMIFVIVILFKKSVTKWEKIAYSLIIGGAFGNLIDRILLGSVTDFLDSDFPDFIMERWPVFNIADSAIVVAVILLFVYTIFFEKRNESEAK